MADDFFDDDAWIEEIFSGKSRSMTFKSVVKKNAANEGFRKFIKHASLKPYVTVGFHQDAGSEPDGKTIAEIAFYQEFGTVDKLGAELIPERSFLRSTVDRNRKKYGDFLEKLIGNIYAGEMDLWQALELYGLQVETDIKATITRLRQPPNAPSTIAQKGSSNPLIDTGAMRAAVRYVVNKGERA